MTKEVEELQNTVAALREAYNAKVHEVTALNTEAGKLRAEIDNLQAKAATAPTIAEVLTDEGFARLNDWFPKGLRGIERPILPTETAISVIWSLARRVNRLRDKVEADLQLFEELQKPQREVFERNIEMAITMSRMTRALAEYAMQAVAE
jgi:regulator of replication initiation timing